jgi:hypothetical protein
MLPDYPNTKKHLQRQALQHLKKVRRQILLNIDEEPILEGDTASYTRSDGSQETMEFKGFESTVMVSDSELYSLSWPDVLKKYEELAVEMGNQAMGHLLEKVKDVTARSGRMVDVGGKLTPEKFISEMRDGIELAFNVDGTPVLPTIVAGDKVQDAIRGVLEKISQDKDLRLNFDAAIEAQRSRWRDRESRRKLVD